MANPQALEANVAAVLGGAGPTQGTAARIAARLRARGVHGVDVGDPKFPEGLRALDDPPLALFVRGVLPPPPSGTVAIVGARACTPYGAGLARRIAADLSRLGCAVISGLARGIDAAAHQGALEAGGPTFAVLPCGLDTVTPPTHARLADAVATAGGLLSERATGGVGFAGAFVLRNRLIAALAGATVVVEAAERSGSLSTAAVARRLGRPVLAVPGDVDRPTSRGTFRLLAAGATPCAEAGDVLRALGGIQPSAAQGIQGRLLGALGPVPRPVDTIAAAVEAPVGEVLAGLLELRLAGLATPVPGQRWRRG